MPATLRDTGTGAALTTCLVHGDRAAFGVVLAGDLPPLPLVLAETVALLRDEFWLVVSAELGRDADDIDLARVWQDSLPLLAGELELAHGFDPELVADALPWLTSAVLEDSAEIPAAHPCGHLAVALAAAALMWHTDDRRQWASFMTGRAVIDARG